MLAGHGLEAISQYPSCGYHIDIVARRGDNRVAIECDGEFWHLDEHGDQKLEDIERQEVLEHAGWRVLRIPYRSWRENSSLQVARILDELQINDDPDAERSEIVTSAATNNGQAMAAIAMDSYEKAIIDALREGESSRVNVYRFARQALGYRMLRSVIRRNPDDAVARLQNKGA